MMAMAAAGMPFSALVFGQGKCKEGYKTTDCPLAKGAATAPIKPVFAPTGWKTVALDHVTFGVKDYRKEAGFYAALMGWRLRSDDGKRAVMDVGDWGTVVLQQASPGAMPSAVVSSVGFVIAPWNAKDVGQQLHKRGVRAVADNDGRGFESYRIQDPGGFEVQISNGNGMAKNRRTTISDQETLPAPFAPTGWKTVWLDHVSFRVTNYKESASFYCNLLGWTSTYDEGSQNECMMGDVGDIIIRGGNPFEASFTNLVRARHAVIDHISFGIEPWDTDRVKAELEKRGLMAEVDTAKSGEIHTAAYKSYHTETPNGYNLQISPVTRQKRLTLSDAVRPQDK